MICYNCSTENPDDQKCCSNCGCTLHRIINEKHSVVISMEQQREIGNYKSKSSYKIAQPTQEEILQKYADKIVLRQRLPEVLAHGMGDNLYLAKFSDKKEMDEFIRFLIQEVA